MAYEDVEWVFGTDLKPTQRLVLLALASCRNRETGKIHPSQKTIGEMTGLAVSAVKRSLGILETDEWITRVKTAKGGYKWNDEYILHQERSTRLVPAEGSASTRPSLQEAQPAGGLHRSLQEADSKKPTVSNQPGTQPGRAPKRATRIPENFEVTIDMRRWAAERAPAVDVDLATERFRNHWTAATRNATKLDWVATWRNWLLGDQERAAERTVRRAAGARQTPLERMQATLALAEVPQHELSPQALKELA